MTIKTIEENNIIIDNYDTKRFKSNTIVVSFSYLGDGKENYLANFLTALLVYNSKKYNTKIKLAKKLEDLYSSNIRSDVRITGKLITTTFILDYINSKYLPEKIDKSAIDLLYEIIFNPNVINNSFDNKAFEFVKENMLSTLKRMEEYSGFYSRNMFLNEFCDGPNKYSFVGEKEQIESITEKSIYEYYKKIIKNNMEISILGDNIDDETINYIKNKFKKEEKRNNIKDIFINSKIKEKVLIKKDKKSFNQSKLLMGYKFKNLTDYEKEFVVPIYNTILGGDINSVLFDTVREKNNLCYNISSRVNKYDSTLIISSGINKVNYDKTVKIIKSCLKEMNNIKTIERLIDVTKMNLNTSLNTFYDDAGAMLNYVYLKNYKTVYSIEKRREMFQKVTIDEVMNLNKKIFLDTIYFLEGDK